MNDAHCMYVAVLFSSKRFKGMFSAGEGNNHRAINPQDFLQHLNLKATVG